MSLVKPMRMLSFDSKVRSPLFLCPPGVQSSWRKPGVKSSRIHSVGTFLEKAGTENRCYSRVRRVTSAASQRCRTLENTFLSVSRPIVLKLFSRTPWFKSWRKFFCQTLTFRVGARQTLAADFTEKNRSVSGRSHFFPLRRFRK